MIYENQGKIAGTENAKVPESKGGAQAPRKAYSLNEHLHNRNNRPISGRANPGSSERDHNECVCKGETARAEEQCA